MPAQPPPDVSGTAGQGELAADRRMKTVSRSQIPCSESGRRDGGAVLYDGANPIPNHRNAKRTQPLMQSPMQRRSPYAQSRAGAKTGVNRKTTIKITNAVKRPPVQRNTQPLEIRSRTVRDPLTTRLVDRRLPRLDHDHLEPGERGPDRRRRTRGTATGDQEIDHFAGAAPSTVASAASSARIRTASSGTFSTVNTSAVIHAV